MIDAVPKITDISSIKGISSLLALPMICVAYILQTGANIGWDGSVWFDVGANLSSSVQLHRLILIFVLKSLWVSGIAVGVYGVIALIHASIDFPLVQVTSVILIAFAIFGLFAKQKFPQIASINTFWFYSFIVWGVFLQTMLEQFDKVPS